MVGKPSGPKIITKGAIEKEDILRLDTAIIFFKLSYDTAIALSFQQLCMRSSEAFRESNRRRTIVTLFGSALVD